MKAFDFSLQTLLDAKEAFEQLSEIRLGEAMRKLQENQEALQRMHKKLHEQVVHAESFNGSKVHGHDLAAHSRHMSWLHQEIDRQLRRITALEDNAEKVRQELLSLMRDIKSMERLKDKQKTKWRLDKNRKEQTEMDEVAVRRHHNESSTD